MATLYGDLDLVQDILLNAGETFPAEGPELTTLAKIQAAVTLALDEKIGRRFTPVTTTLTAWANGMSDLLLLPSGNLSVTAVASGDVVLPTSAYQRTFITLDGRAGALRLLSGGYWYGDIEITGTWVNTAPLDPDAEPPDPIPADIQYAASYIIAKQYQYQNLSPSGASGPDGTRHYVANPWKSEIVLAAINRYRLCEVVV